MTDAPAFECLCSRQFMAWLVEQRTSLVFSTYQAGKLFLLGADERGELALFNRTFERCMGLATSANQLYMSNLYQLWRFDNSLAPGQVFDGYDRCFVPQLAWTTGDVDIHDIGLGADGRPVFANTLFSCVATVSDSHSFKPLWRPPFITRLAAEDRCHLNGLAMTGGEPRYVSCVSRSDVADGWRDRRVDGGCVIDVASNELVLEGLSMPHSPRLYRDRLWLLDSGNGYFGYADLEAGRFERVCFCPGYARGLTFVGDFAVIGLSGPRHNKTFSGLPLDDALRRHDVDPRCGLLVVDLRTGDAPHWVRISGRVEELYDVVALEGVVRPMAIGFRSDEIRRLVSIE